MTSIDSAYISDLVNRLNGIYNIPITDGLGAVEEGGDENVFTRTFPSPPINKEAATVIEQFSDMFGLIFDAMQERGDLVDKLYSMSEDERTKVLDPICDVIFALIKEQDPHVSPNRIFALMVIELYELWRISALSR